MTIKRISFIDTHTCGEPTRVIESGIDLKGATLRELRDDFQQRFDTLRRAIICEPRGHEVLVGALVTEPENPESSAGVIFFNNVGYLGMCGHGTIGVAVALKYAKRMLPGMHQFDTPVGSIAVELHNDQEVTFRNVPSYRYRANVPVPLANGRIVHGDIAWGGNWFFICKDHGLRIEIENLKSLEQTCLQIRSTLAKSDITGEGGAEIDHIELTGPASDPGLADAKNFVLCPGGAYDRSPCGTGTSAKIACLSADRLLKPGDTFRIQSIIGSVFEGGYEVDDDDQIIPIIRGSAHICTEGHLILDDEDPFCFGIGDS